MASPEIQSISDKGEIEAERETAYLLKSDAMRRRLLDAKDRKEGLSLEAAVEKLRI